MNIPRRALFGRLSTELFRSIESATAFAKLRGNPYVEMAHWLHQIWQVPGGDLPRLTIHYGIDAAQFEKDLIVALAQLPNGASGLNDFSHTIELAIERAWVFASLIIGDNRIRTGWLLAAILQTPELRRLTIGISPTFQQIPVALISEDFPRIISGSSEDRQEAYEATNLNAAVPGDAGNAWGHAVESKSPLSLYCTDLTALARKGAIDPVVGREQEIRTMANILLRRRQNNPLLTGEAGVGKTAVVEGLALAIASKKVPPSLHAVRILSLDVGALLAGASMRGEFESRLKLVIKEACDAQAPIVLFVDEVHTLVGAGGQSGTGDAANLLKPALARGALRVVGATTWSEYKKHIEKDPALTRRFQALQVLEPQEVAAINMVRGLVPVLSKHHGVTILEVAVRAAVKLSHRYIPARQLPDKAISLLDTACARVAMSLHEPSQALQQVDAELDALQGEQYMLLQAAAVGKGIRRELDELQMRIAALEGQRDGHLAQSERVRSLTTSILSIRELLQSPGGMDNKLERTQEVQRLEHELEFLQGDKPSIHLEVNEGVVASIVADWTGIPVGRMLGNEMTAVMSLEKQLQKRVVGQDAAIRTLVERVKTSKAGLSDPGKPIATFLLVGPSGVGKTETALALAHAMYGGEHNLISINMSEFQEAHTVSSLKGAPPGYVGYGEGGVLTEAVRRRPYSVILLDEVEKAHSDVHELFYQVFDKGWMEDGEGRVIDFKNTLILMTSNTGSELISTLCEDGALAPDAKALSDALQPELRKVFPAALLGRMSVVPYFPLSSELLASIVALQLQKVVSRMQEQHSIAMECSEQAIAHIVAQCGTHEAGARRINHFIEHNVLTQLAQAWLQAMQEHLVISKVMLQTEQEIQSQTQQMTFVEPKAGLGLRVEFKA